MSARQVIVALCWSVGLTAALTGCRRAQEPERVEPVEVGVREPAGPAWFEIVPAHSGLDYQYRSGATGAYFYPETFGGGVGLCDVDGDGDLDVYFPQGGPLDDSGTTHEGRNRLFLNRGDATFEDATDGSGAGHGGYGMGVACGDVDNDGDVDLYVTNLGENVLLRNRGDGTFEDTTAQGGVGDASWSVSSTFLDFDGDGWLDLFVVNYLHWSPRIERECLNVDGERDYCGPLLYRSPARDTLYRNLGGGRFRDVSAEVGLGAAFGNGLGVVADDFDGDTRIDIYVANDQTANQLWINQGDGTFVDRSLLAGAALSGTGRAEAGMGVVTADLDGDGWLDLFLSHISGESNTLYANRDGLFEDITAARRLAAPSFPYTGFGTGFADFDHDGRLDLFVTNGRVKSELPVFDPEDPFAEPDLLFRGLAEGFFDEVRAYDTARPNTGRGAGFGDLDGDGDLDVVVVNRDRPVTLLRNVVAERHWLMVRVLDRNGRDAVGARVRVESGGHWQTRSIQPGYGYLSSNDPRAHFGLWEASSVDLIEVTWPGGATSSHGPFEVDQVVVLRGGTHS